MLVMYEVFDDGTAIVLDIGTFEKRECTESELIRLGKVHDVLGLSVGERSINYMNAYNCISFPTENDANDYIKDNSLSYRNKIYASNLWWVMERNNKVTHVDYYVAFHTGNGEYCYVGDKGGYTPYIQAAKKYTKREAGETAGVMRNKGGKNWQSIRVVDRGYGFRR